MDWSAVTGGALEPDALCAEASSAANGAEEARLSGCHAEAIRLIEQTYRILDLLAASANTATHRLSNGEEAAC